MIEINNIYIHIPFCLKKCNYCSFFSIPKKPFEEYFDALKKEIEIYQNKYNLLPETIYFGGGTPSLVSPEIISKIINIQIIIVIMQSVA